MWDLGTAILIIVGLGTGLVLLVWAVSISFPTVTRIVPRSFWCPVQGRNVTAEFQEAAWDGKPVEVNRCSAFSPSQAVTCTKVCLRLEKLPLVRGSAPPL